MIKHFLILTVFLISSIKASESDADIEISRLKQEIYLLKFEVKLLYRTCAQETSEGYQTQFFNNKSSESVVHDETNQVSSPTSCKSLREEFNEFHKIVEDTKSKTRLLTTVVDGLLEYADSNIKKTEPVTEIQADEDFEEALLEKEENFKMFDGFEEVDDEDEEDFKVEIEVEEKYPEPNDDVEVVAHDEIEQLHTCQGNLTEEKETFKELKKNCTVEINLLKLELKKTEIMNKIPLNCQKIPEIEKLSAELIKFSQENQEKIDEIKFLRQRIREIKHKDHDLNIESKSGVVENFEMKEEIDDIKIMNEVLKIETSMSHAEILTEKKSTEIDNVFHDLQKSFEKTDVKKAAKEIDDIIRRRGSNLRRNPQLKKFLDKKIENLRRQIDYGVQEISFNITIDWDELVNFGKTIMQDLMSGEGPISSKLKDIGNFLSDLFTKRRSHAELRKSELNLEISAAKEARENKKLRRNSRKSRRSSENSGPNWRRSYFRKSVTERRSDVQQNHLAINDKIVELNILLDKQHKILNNGTKELNARIEKLEASYPDNEEIRQKIGELREKLEARNLVYKEKYAFMEDHVNTIQDIRNDEIKVEKQLHESEIILEEVLHDAVDDDEDEPFNPNELTERVKKECGKVMDENKKLVTEKKEIDKKLKDAQEEHKTWLTKAKKCKCFYKGWFNKNCKF